MAECDVNCISEVVAMALTIKNLNEVWKLLFNIGEKWFYIGMELGINIEDLDLIRKKNDDPRMCLLEMLRIWLKSINPQPTWKILADVLRGKTINEVALAEEGINSTI